MDEVDIKMQRLNKAEFVYLSLGDEILIENGKAEDGYYHAKDENLNEVWVQGNDEDNNKVMTMLISYHDNQFEWSADLDKDYRQEVQEWYESTTQGRLTKLSNEGSDQFWEELFEMVEEALCKLDTKTFKKIYKSMSKPKMTFYSRTVDFSMHEPRKDYIHMSYCT